MTESPMPHRDPAARPANVGTAVRLMYAALGLSFISFLIDRSWIPVNIAEARWPNWIFFGGVFFILFGLSFLLIYMIGAGKNWVRMIYLVLYILMILSLPFSMKPFLQAVSNAPALGILELVQVVIQGIALVLVFQRDSSAWFKAMKQARADFSMHR
ncbi:MAG: hypothetical protein SCM96_15445 [Acidobacteriota bacterium]|nr:hypothetical protein [Acidobacteriota bacterium]